MAARPVVLAQVGGQLAESASIVEDPHEALGFAEVAEDPLGVSEWKERRPKIEAQIDRLLQRATVLGQMLERRQRLLQTRHGVSVGGPRDRPGAGLTEVRDGLLPELPPEGMVGEPLVLPGQPVRIQALDGVDDAGVEGRALLREKATVRDFVGERVLEGVLGIRRHACPVQELGGLQTVEPAAHGLLRDIRDGLEQRDGHVLSDDGGDLQEVSVLHLEPVDPGGQHRLHRRRDRDGVDRMRQSMPATVSRKHARLDEHPDRLFQKERVALSDEKLLEGKQPGIVAE